MIKKGVGQQSVFLFFRNLLKDIYDMVLKSKEIEDIQNFELVSHNFGVRNILNHLSLVDLYFGELGTELESKI